MPRRSRQSASTNTYHVVIRGLDRQVMFENTKDYLKYLDILLYYKTECNFTLYAYCLMSNHVHLILHTDTTPLDTIFRKINTHYSVWFNMKYQRTGPLLQGRFYSEPIEDAAYLLTAIRYVHRNPAKSGLEEEVGADYPWSSIHEYFKNDPILADIDKTYELITPDDFLEYCRYSSAKNASSASDDDSDSCLDIDTIQKRLPDDVAREIILELTNCRTATEFQKLSLVDRNTAIRKCRERGLSIRQINRLTGTPRGVIQRIH